jgi:hypothetical protein
MMMMGVSWTAELRSVVSSDSRSRRCERYTINDFNMTKHCGVWCIAKRIDLGCEQQKKAKSPNAEERERWDRAAAISTAAFASSYRTNQENEIAKNKSKRNT